MNTLDPRQGCTPFDIGLAMQKFWPDMDKIARITELVRRNLRQIDLLLPSDARAWLMQGQTSAHSGGTYPIIGLVFVSEPPASWSFSDLYSKIEEWLSARETKIDTLIQTVVCPTWHQLEHGMIFPLNGEF